MKRLLFVCALLLTFVAGHVTPPAATRFVFPSLLNLIEAPVYATYTPTPLKSIQYVSCGSMNGVTSTTPSITSVNTSAAAVYTAGDDTSGSASPFDPGIHMAKKILTNATTVTCTRAVSSTDGFTPRFAVVEFLPQFIKSVQATSVTGNGSTVITSVNTAKTVLFDNGRTSTFGSTTDSNPYSATFTLTDATHVGSSANIYATTTQWVTVLEFK